MSTDDFVALGSELTGFAEFDLVGTGQAPSYLAAAVRGGGWEPIADLLSAYRTGVTATADEQVRRQQLDDAVLSDPRLGPLARNLIKLWYCGVWFELPADWRRTYGTDGVPGTFTASPQAYPEGLLWYAIGANPPGARAPGYGSWAQPPRIPEPPASAVPYSLTAASARSAD